MVILRTRNKITDFFNILAWASPFNKNTGVLLSCGLFARTLCFLAACYDRGIWAIIRLWYTKIGHHHQNLEYP